MEEESRFDVVGCYLDLKACAITLIAADRRTFRLTFSPHGLAARLLSRDPEIPHAPPGLITEAQKPPTVTLTGKLKTKPKEGNPDGKGKPTAFALLAVHEEG